MANVKYMEALDGYYLYEAYSDFYIYDVNKAGTKAAFEDANYGTEIVLTGEHIKANDTGIISGSVDHITFTSEKGETLATVAGNYDAKDIFKVLATRGAQTTVQFIFDGNDTFTGSDGYDSLWGYDGNDRINGGKGGDEIHGGKGRDLMTGGPGSDLFVFWQGDGKDVIRDFDASGGGDHQDYLYVPKEHHFTIKADKDGDAMLLFDNGDTLTLEGVARKQITMDDFYAA